MSWVRLDDGFWANPKVIAAGNEAAGVFSRALSYCGNHHTNGDISAEVLKFIAGRRKPVEQLLDNKLITRKGHGYAIPDYLEFNPSREEKAAEREAARLRMEKVRANQRERSGERAPKFGSGSATPSRPVVSKETNAREEFDEWLGHFHATTGRTAVKGSANARRQFAARRSEGRPVSDLKLATAGAHGDEYLREHGYDTPDTILRASKVERYIELGRSANGQNSAGFDEQMRKFAK